MRKMRLNKPGKGLKLEGTFKKNKKQKTAVSEVCKSYCLTGSMCKSRTPDSSGFSPEGTLISASAVTYRRWPICNATVGISVEA